MSVLLAILAGAAARGGVLLALALLASLAMRRASAAARHAVLAFGILAQLLVVLVPAAMPRLAVPYPASQTAVVERAVDHVGAPVVPIRAPGEDRGEASEPVAPASSGAPAVAWLAVLAWAVVAGAISLRYLVGHLRVSRLRSRSRPADAGLPRGVLAAAARAAGLRRAVAVRLADVPMPVACGIARPAVLLPDAAAGWSRKRLRMVLVHELAHVRRCDVPIQGLVQLTCALFWFDPLLWWARSRLRAEAESAADDAVVRAGSPADRYVLELVGLLREAPPVSCPAAAASIGRDLGARAVRVLDPGIRRGSVGRGSLAAGATLALVATLLLGAATPAARGPGAGRSLDGLATGCAWRPDGRHLNRWIGTPEKPRWQVLWQGEDCEIELLAEPAATLADGILAPPVTGGRVVVRVRTRATTDSASLRRDDGGDLHIIASPGLTGETQLATWLRGFADEVALHTAFDAPATVEELLRADGVPAVLEHTDATQGDHAAGVYLTRLVESRRLANDELVRALRIAAVHVSNDAVMTGLLQTVARRYPVGDPGPVRAAFEDAAGTLQARAARDAVRRSY